MLFTEMLDSRVRRRMEGEQDTGTRTVGRARGEVSIRNVTFRYPGAERDALRAVSLEIPAGATVA